MSVRLKVKYRDWLTREGYIEGVTDSSIGGLKYLIYDIKTNKLEYIEAHQIIEILGYEEVNLNKT